MNAASATAHSDIRSKHEGRDEVQAAVNQVHQWLVQAGVRWSPSKVSKTVRQYNYQVRSSGMSLGRYVAGQLQQAGNSAAAARFLTYADPTGETAVANVMRSN